MNWDEKTEDHASAHHTYEHRGYRENKRFHKMFVKGAEWQRDQLRTDEAVELAAEAIWSTDPAPALEPFDGPDTWDGQEPEVKNDYRKAVRTVISVLLGEEP